MDINNTSTGVKLTDLNDFIKPSTQCIKPLITEEPAPTQLLIKKNDNLSKKNVVTGKIKLDDCLACSGCVTSAEVVFIEQQSINEFLDFVKINKNTINKKMIIVSISPQSVISIAHSFKLSINETISMLVQYFKNECDANWILNHSEINQLCLLESAYEFVDTFKLNSNSRIFSSSCPGWACYAEKRCDEKTVNDLSHVRSIQGIMGAIIKRTLIAKNNKIYHVAIMPCFDRKLEAARSDMKIKDILNNEEKETDIVLTTYEVQEHLKNFYNLNLNTEYLVEKDKEFIENKLNFSNILTFNSIYEMNLQYNNLNNFTRNIGGESGGLAIGVFVYACQILYGLNIEIYKKERNQVEIECVKLQHSDYQIKDSFIKSTDYYEFWLEKINVEKPQILLRFAKVYGFRNIQNLLLRLKKLPNNYYHYIEVMACPNGGCLNGGGQVLFHTQNSVIQKNNLLKQIRKDYLSLPIIDQNQSCENLKKFIDKQNFPLKTKFKSVKNFNQTLQNDTQNNSSVLSASLPLSW